MVIVVIIGLTGALVGQVISQESVVDKVYRLYQERDFDALHTALEGIEQDQVGSWNSKSRLIYWSVYSRYHLIVAGDMDKYGQGLVSIGAVEHEGVPDGLSKVTSGFLAAYLWYKKSEWSKADSTLNTINNKDELVADPLLEGEVYLLAARVRTKLGKREEAIAAYKMAIEVWDRMEAHAWSAYASCRLADYFTDVKEPNEALLYYEKARESSSKAAGEISRGVADSYAAMGLVHGNIRNFDYSVSALKKGITIYRALNPVPERALADALDDLGFVYCNFSPDSALPYIRNGLQLRRKIFSGPHAQVARSYNSMGTYFRYLDAPNLDSSTYYFTKELEMLELLEPESQVTGLRYFELARTYLRMEAFETSRMAFSKGLQILTASPQADYVDSLPAYQSFKVPYFGLDAMFYLSQYYESRQVVLGDTSAIFKTIECADLALQINDSLWNSYSLTGAKLILSNRTYPMLGYAVSAALDAYEILGEEVYAQRALKFAERRKAMLLNESFERSLSDDVIIPEAVRKREAQINYKLTHYRAEQEKVRENPDKYDVSYAHQVTEQVMAYLHLRDSMAVVIKNRWPSYFRKRSLMTLPTLDDVRSKLDSQTVLLSYSIHLPFTNDTTDEVNCFLISKGGLEIRRFMLDSSLSTDIRRLRKLIGEKDYDEYIKLAHKLYEMLLAPLNITHQNVVIIPEGELANLPFDALIKSPPVSGASKSFNQLDYLVKHNTISFANSIWYWYYTNDNRQPIAREVWGMAPFK